MKSVNRSIKKKIKKKIDLQQNNKNMGVRNNIRLTPLNSKPLAVELLSSRIEIRSGIKIVKVKKQGIPFSIIVTAYNTDEFIEECLDSIENQTHFKENNNFEVLLGIDSCEKTLNKVLSIRHKYRNLKIFMMNKNVGTYITSNTLLKHVKFENVIRFDSDDIMRPIMVEEILIYIKEYNVIRFQFINLALVGNERKETIINYHAKGAIFFKRSLMNNLGGYMPWRCAADAELLVRGKSEISEKLIDERLFYRRLHKNNLIFKYDGYSEIRKKNESLVGKHESIKIDSIIGEAEEIPQIPKRMIFYWSGSKLSWMRYMTFYSFRKYNPDWEIVLCLSNDDFKNSPQSQIFNMYVGDDYFHKLNELDVKIINVEFPKEYENEISQLSPIHKSDLYRYYILSKNGGLYCDTDVIFFRPINEFYNKIVSENYNTIIHESPRNFLTIGFLGSSQENKYYNDLFEYGIKNINIDGPQAMGVDLIYKFIGGRRKIIFDLIDEKYSKIKLFNLPSELIYNFEVEDIRDCFYNGKNKNSFPKDSIGYHWYGGHPISQKYNNILTEKNFESYNTTISKIAKYVINKK